MDLSEGSKEELVALESIYGEDFEALQDGYYKVSINLDDKHTLFFCFSLPCLYPQSQPPLYELQGPPDWIQQSQLDYLSDQVSEQVAFVPGEVILYQWIEWLRENAISTACISFEREPVHKESSVSSSEKNNRIVENFRRVDTPRIIHGEPFVDRKSKFIAHAAHVFSPNDVKLVLDDLYTDHRISIATHNMYAYRIVDDNGKTEEYRNDDGEHGAGEKMLNLLVQLDEKHSLVVVSRWFGGTLLGVDRFRHIVNLTKEIVQSKEFFEEGVKALEEKKKREEIELRKNERDQED